MKFRHVWIVFRKEVKDLIRDKKTIITSLLVPMILVPTLNLLLGNGVEKMQKDISENVTIALSQSSQTSEIKKLVEDKIIINNPNIKLINVDDPLAALKQNKVRLVLDIEKDYADKLKANKPFTINFLYDKSNAKSAGALPILNSAIMKFNSDTVGQRLSVLGINKNILEPAKIEQTNVADEKKTGNQFLATILPLMVGLLVVVGGIPAATDLVAGEKERNTFEPLLTTKANRLAIVLGKYMTVTLFSFISIIAIAIGFMAGYLINPNMLSMGGNDQFGGFHLPLIALISVILITIFMGMTFSGIQIALSTYARSFKEAQTYLSLLIFVAMIPSYATMYLQSTDIQSYMFALPILNTISALKMVLSGNINYMNLLIALSTSIIYVLASVFFAVSLFNKEEVVFRS